MKKLVLFGLVNFLVLVASLAVGMYATVMAGRYFARDVIFIAPFLNESHLHWNMDDVRNLQHQFRDYSISVESRGNALLQTSTHQVFTTVVYTDAAYFQIHSMEFIEGNRWLEDANAIVLNEALAWRLFGGRNIVGLAVEINQRPYIIAGVVRQDQRGQGEYLAWMPRDTSPVPLPVTALYVHAHNYNMVDVIAHTRGSEGMLASQYRNPNNYVIVDINRYVQAIGLRNRVFMYIIWLYVLVLLIGVCIRKERKLYRRAILKFALPVIGILIALYVLFTGVNDILYWLPNLADPRSSVLDSITNAGVFPPDGYLSFGLRRLAELNRLVNLIWIVGVIAFVNMIFSISFLQGRHIE